MLTERGGCVVYGCELCRRSASRGPLGPVPASQCRAPASCICDSASQVLPPTQDGRCLRAKLGSLSGLVRRGTGGRAGLKLVKATFSPISTTSATGEDQESGLG